jgi:hypothetical protein
MLRHIVSSIALVMACASCASTGTSYFGFEVGVRSAPPPPRVVLAGDPHLVVVEGSGVFVVDNAPSDYDMFRYGSYWYVCYDGYWYRARSYNGTYTVVDVRSVPRRVVSVPERHWRHHPHGGPPGQTKKRGDRDDRGDWGT